MRDMLIPFLSVLILLLASLTYFPWVLDVFTDLSTTIIELLMPIYIPSSFGSFGRKCLIEFVEEKQLRFRQTQKVWNQYDIRSWDYKHLTTE